MILKTDSTACDNIGILTKQVGRYFKSAGKLYLVRRVDIARVPQSDGVIRAEIEVANLDPQMVNKHTGKVYCRVYGTKGFLCNLAAAR